MLNFKYYDYFDNKKECQAVKAVSSYEGKTVYGISYLHPDDAYDYETGKIIAKYRCTLKIIERKIKRYGRKSKSVQEDILWLVNELNRLTNVLKMYEEVIEDAVAEQKSVNANLQEILEKLS